jgi:hypothetical protein
MRKREVISALNKLGKTAREVADTLKEKGIIGNRRMAKTCPISQYLHSCDHPSGTQPSTSSCSIGYSKRGILSQEEIPLPVREFIDAFDAGEFPELTKRVE